MNYMKLFVTFLVFFLFPYPVTAGANEPIKGIYTQIPNYKYVFNGENVEVVEFFSFYCKHCYDLEKSIPVIKGNFPKKIKWKSVPVYWGQGSSKPGEAYLLAEEKNMGEQMKKALFNAFFTEKRDISDINVLEGIGAKLNLGFDFSRRLRSGDKAKEANAALIMMQAYNIDETPTLIIAGNIKVNPHMLNHNMDIFRDNTITILKSILKK